MTQVASPDDDLGARAAPDVDGSSVAPGLPPRAVARAVRCARNLFVVLVARRDAVTLRGQVRAERDVITADPAASRTLTLTFGQRIEVKNVSSEGAVMARNTCDVTRTLVVVRMRA